MFCPNCGANQTGKKFCTTCGTNLGVVSQAVSGQVLTTPYPPMPDLHAAERERQATKGLKLTVTGGILVAIYLFCFTLSLPFRGGEGGFVGFLGFIGLVMAAIGAGKLASARPPYATSMRQMPMPAPPTYTNQLRAPGAVPYSAPPPIFSAPTPTENSTPTSVFASTPQPPSVLEEATQHLPEYAPPREAPK